jgi:lipopolysaccharide export system protein LptA
MLTNASTPSSCPISSSNRARTRRIAAQSGSVERHDRPAGGVRFLARAPQQMIAGALLTFGMLLAVPVGALPEDADQPIHIRADTAEIDQQSERVIYRGSVRVDQGTLRVTADTMTIEYEDQKVVRIIAVGAPAHYQQQLESDEGQVKADALTIIYHTRDERIDLKGNANLEQEGSTLAGDLIVYDIVAGRVDASAESSKPVRMVLQPAATKTVGAGSGDVEQ